MAATIIFSAAEVYPLGLFSIEYGTLLFVPFVGMSTHSVSPRRLSISSANGPFGVTLTFALRILTYKYSPKCMFRRLYCLLISALYLKVTPPSYNSSAQPNPKPFVVTPQFNMVVNVGCFSTSFSFGSYSAASRSLCRVLRSQR